MISSGDRNIHGYPNTQHKAGTRATKTHTDMKHPDPSGSATLERQSIENMDTPGTLPLSLPPFTTTDSKGPNHLCTFCPKDLGCPNASDIQHVDAL